MIIQFNKQVSRILDYLMFPKMYFMVKDYKQLNDDVFKTVISQEYLDYAKKMETTLIQSKQMIEELFEDNIYSVYDYINLLIKAYPPYEDVDEHQYLQRLASIEAEPFKLAMIEALLNIEEDNQIDKSVDEKNAMAYIHELNIAPANKWNLLLMIQDPKTQLKKLTDLLKEYEDIFYKYYKEKEAMVLEVGHRLEETLSHKTVDSLNQLTFQSINYDFKEGESCYIYVSSLFPYTMRILEDNDLRIVWGLEMESAFKKVHEINENKLLNRVKVFKALGDKTRYETLKLLAEGVDSVKKIAATLNVSSATISYHINEFLTAGIVHIHRGKETQSTYQVDYDCLNEVIRGFKDDLSF